MSSSAIDHATVTLAQTAEEPSPASRKRIVTSQFMDDNDDDDEVVQSESVAPAKRSRNASVSKKTSSMGGGTTTAPPPPSSKVTKASTTTITTTQQQARLSPPPPPPSSSSSSMPPPSLRRTDSTTIFPSSSGDIIASGASNEIAAKAKETTASYDRGDDEDADDDKESTASFVEDRAHRSAPVCDEEERDRAVDDSSDSSSSFTATTLSESTTHHSITNRDINLAADEDNVPPLSEDKLYEATLVGGDAVIKFLSVIGGKTAKAGGETATAFLLKEIKGNLYITVNTHLPPAAYICHCRVRMRIADDATFEPFALPTNKIVMALSNTKPTNSITMTVYREAPSTLVICERDPEEGIHGARKIQIPMLMPSEELLCEPPVIPNTHSIPFTRNDLTNITTTAQRLFAAVNFRIYEFEDKALLLVKLVNPKDDTTVITYMYMMSIKQLDNSTALVADPTSVESEDKIKERIRTTKPVVDDSFNASALRMLTHLPSMGNNIRLFVGGETDQELKQPLCMVTQYGSDVTFGVIIMSNSTDIGEDAE